MLYYKRHELTKMSMWHMSNVIQFFNQQGVEAKGIIVGDEQPIMDYAEELGLEHYECKNDPLSEKFNFAIEKAVDQGMDYICWLGSNNFSQIGYWEKALTHLKNNESVSFGTTRFVVVDRNPNKQSTYLFKTRKTIHLCSHGQFYKTSAMKGIGFGSESVFNKNKSKDFDGSLNKLLTYKHGGVAVKNITVGEYDCFDIKDISENINSYESYNGYPKGKSRDEIFDKYEELQLLKQGYFK